jgi:hypothetical protein
MIVNIRLIAIAGSPAAESRGVPARDEHGAVYRRGRSVRHPLLRLIFLNRSKTLAIFAIFPFIDALAPHWYIFRFISRKFWPILEASTSFCGRLGFSSEPRPAENRVLPAKNHVRIADLRRFFDWEALSWPKLVPRLPLLAAK